MTTLLVTHPACSAHDMGEGHPERPERLRAVDQALEDEIFPAARARHRAARRDRGADAGPSRSTTSRRSSAPARARARSSSIPTPRCRRAPCEAALRSAGGATFAVDEVVARRVDNAFVATRPPGHHAETATPMGFCFFNNAAVAARHAQAAHGVERVAIVDFDVHHGNGTQDIFWSDPSRHVRVDPPDAALSRHRRARARRGEHDQIVNAPLRAGDGGDAFREAFETAILPRLDDFAPDLLIISAGFDAHFRDPLGGLNLSEADFAWATRAPHRARRTALRRPRRLAARGRLRSRRPGALRRRPCRRAEPGSRAVHRVERRFRSPLSPLAGRGAG